MTIASDCSLGVANNVVVSVGEGDSKQDFNVPEFFAVKSSKFMQTTLGGNWKESHQKRVSLPKAKVCDFEMYLEWLYTTQIDLLDTSSGRGVTLVQLYLLGTSSSTIDSATLSSTCSSAKLDPPTCTCRCNSKQRK